MSDSFHERWQTVQKTVEKTVRETTEQLRQGYREANDFGRMRIWIVAFLAVDVMVVLFVLATVGGTPQDFQLTFQSGFPGNMVIVRNLSGRRRTGLEVDLDGTYTAEIETIEAFQTLGLELIREFHDDDGASPSPGYRPQRAVLRRGSQQEVFDLSSP